MAILSSAVTLLPSCNLETVPVYENIPIDKPQRKLIEQLTEAILPKKNTAVVTPEKTVDYVLTIINDCHAPEEIEQYISGLKELQLLLKEQFKSSFQQLTPEAQNALFALLQDAENSSANLRHFYTTTHYLTKDHFVTSEYFMTNYLEYEFIPGRYLGCVDI